MSMLTQPIGAAPSGAVSAGAGYRGAVDEIANSSPVSGVSWPAVFAGGITAAAVSVILLLFGAGLGLSSVSPWPHSGVSATTFTVLAAIWLIIVQWVASLFGGYMAGRLRTKWVGVHTDEVFFRDTAHGFLAWSLGTLIVAGMLAMAAAGATGTGTQAAATLAANNSQNAYFVDELFRQNVNPNAAADGGSALAPAAPASAADVTGLSDAQVRAQAATILAEGVTNGGVDATDTAYLTQLVSGRTGLAPADAQARVTDVLNQEQAAIAKTKQVADAARKASAMAAIYTFVSLLIGAFIASVAGAIGGRLRDTY
jgi:hypothetical protein